MQLGRYLPGRGTNDEDQDVSSANAYRTGTTLRDITIGENSVAGSRRERDDNEVR